MMLVRLLPLLLVLLAGKVFARESPIEVFEYIDDVKIVAFIKESDIERGLYWAPFEGSPPLTISKALANVYKHLAANPKLAKATLVEIKLKEIPRHKGYWHYLIKLNTKTNHKLHSYYFVVLMDGKIFPALREPESFK